MTVQRVRNVFLFILIFSTFGGVVLTDGNNATNYSRKTIDDESVVANLTANNDLWSLLLRDCKKPTLRCVRDNIYAYLNNTFNFSSDVQFTSFLKFAKNSNSYDAVPKSSDSGSHESTSKLPELYEDESPLQEMSRSLHDDTVKFFMTHDMQVDLPEPFFQGSVLKISPRSLEDSGALVKLEVMPKEDSENNEVGDGRLFFKKIKKFINEKLIYALLAILLVVKLLAVKLLFILPLIVGAATAKKLLIKILLFLFPALHHLFKFCAYYPTQAKYHHHKHLISHIHSVAHPHKHGPPPPHHSHHDGVEVIAPHGEGPPSGGFHGGHIIHDDHHHDLYDPYEDDLLGKLYPAVPGLGNDILSHRNDPYKEENEVVPWGQEYPTTTKRPRPKPDHRRPLTPSQIEAELLKAEKEALIKAKLQKERKRIHEENLRLQDQLIKEVKIREKLKQHAAVIHSKLPPFVSPSMMNNLNGLAPPPPGQMLPPDPIGTPSNMRPVAGVNLPHSIPQKYLPQQQIQNKVSTQAAIAQANQHQLQANRQNQPSPQTQIMSQAGTQTDAQKVHQTDSQKKPQPVYQHSQNVQNSNVDSSKLVITTTKKPNPVEEEIYKAASITYDKFYSPILQKIDKILEGLGFNEEPCRERLICSMYKNPTKFSPHSNLLSAELSRDPSELQKPTSTDAVVIRFYKYVQAARDGQDGRDCLRLYPTCAVNTEL